MDYRAWINGVRRFAKDLRKLPGELSLEEFEIAPPLSAKAADTFAAKWQTGLPDSLRRLWMDGSSKITCPYAWTPPPEELPLVQAIFKDGVDICGGVRFEPAEEIFPGNAADMIDPGRHSRNLERYGELGLALWQRSAVFLHVGNGDRLALDPETNPADPAVVSLQHDNKFSDYISPSFSEFLTVWTELCFIGPEWWLLNYWLDEKATRIVLGRHKTAELRTLLTPRANPKP